MPGYGAHVPIDAIDPFLPFAALDFSQRTLVVGPSFARRDFLI
jgi:hypothetical protein